MSYESEVMARAPALYARLDKTGVDADGDTWPDISGNGLDLVQVYQNVPSRVARGWTSPIETDGPSREFEGWTNNSIEGAEFGVNGVSRLYAPTDPLIEPAGDFTMLCWLRLMADIPSAGDFVMAGKDHSLGIGLSWSGGTRLAGFVKDSGGTIYKAVDTSFLVSDYLGTSFLVSVRRIANTLKLDVNAQLRDTQTVSSGLPTNVSADNFFVHPDTGFRLHARYDEPALFTYALSDDDILEIYEAALSTLPLVGRADLRLIGILNGRQEPEPQFFAFSHNWESEVAETLAWATDVIPADQDYEQRAAIRQRPVRELEFDAFIGDNKLRRRFHAFLFQNQRRTIYLGDWTEATLLTQNVLSGATSLDFLSTGRGYEDGRPLAIYTDEDNYEIVTIDEVGETSTSLLTPTTRAWSSAAVVPLVRAFVAEDLQFDRHTDRLEESRILFRVLAQDVPLAPRRNGTYTPRYTYQGIEVFDPFVLGTGNWDETGRGRATIRVVDPGSNTGTFSREPNDSASREIISYSFFLHGREEIARFLAWAWSVQGRRVPLWVPTLQEDFEVVSTAGSSPATLVVDGHDYTDFYQAHPARRDLALVYEDETIVCKRIASAETAGDDDELTIEQTGALSLTNLRVASFLKLSRLNEDKIGLVWATDELVEVTLNFIDLLTTP